MILYPAYKSLSFASIKLNEKQKTQIEINKIVEIKVDMRNFSKIEFWNDYRFGKKDEFKICVEFIFNSPK